MAPRAFAERAGGELLATGATVRRCTIDVEEPLTPQEVQNARPARDGLSNVEIGSQLFRSARTVEWHLRKVFRKLKHQVAAAAPHVPAGSRVNPAPNM